MTTYTGNCSRSTVETSLGIIEKLNRQFSDWMNTQRLKFRIHQERKALSEMSNAMLKDIGISRVQADQEAQRDSIPVARLLTRPGISD